jgi:cbb3-type cytochrome oxidase maturation protein
MIEFFFLIPIAIGLGLIGLASFMWTLKNGQYDDLEGAAARILFGGRSRPAAGKAVSGGGSSRRKGGRAGQPIRLAAKPDNFEELPDNILLAFFQKHLNSRLQTRLRRNRRGGDLKPRCGQPTIWVAASPGDHLLRKQQRYHEFRARKTSGGE